LTDFSFAKQVPKGWNKPMFDIAQYTTYYSVAASLSCTDIGFGSTTMAPERKNLQSTTDAMALDGCNKGCNCEILISNGKVSMTKAQAMLMSSADLINGNKNNQEELENLKNYYKIDKELQASDRRRRRR